MAEELSGPHVGYLGLLRRIASHWRLSLIVCVGVAAPVAVWALLFLPKSYEAVAAIFIEDPRRGSVSTLRDWMPAGDASYQQAVLRSRSLAAAVVDNLPQDSMNELIRHAMHRDYVLAGQNLIRRLLGHEPVVFSPQQRAVRELLTARIRFESLPSGRAKSGRSAIIRKSRRTWQTPTLKSCSLGAGPISGTKRARPGSSSRTFWPRRKPTCKRPRRAWQSTSGAVRSSFPSAPRSRWPSSPSSRAIWRISRPARKSPNDGWPV